VNAAKQFGYVFAKRDEDENIIIRDEVNKRELKYKLLNVCEFTSTRKRMSCIFKDPSGKIILMCKGADTVITERLTAESLNSNVFKQTQGNVDAFAQEGLRTLFLAEKEIDEMTYLEWNMKSI